ncbi:MAG: hypothetical protein DWQ37_04835 [Planctomycetota bacterium]|nr:MAG: hypothetical protein DWQ37_04835 [Planctomycetota bacterium]
MAQQNPDAAPHGESGTPAAAPRRRGLAALVWFCLAFYALAILSGVHTVAAWEPNDAGDHVYSFALVICLGYWATGDARRRGEPICRSLRIWFYVFATIVVPGYVIGTRGWKGLGWVLLHALCWYALYAIVFQVTGTLAFGASWWGIADA